MAAPVYQGLHQFLRAPDDLNLIRNNKRYVSWNHGGHTTIMSHSHFQSAMSGFKDVVRDQNNGHLQIDERINNPHYKRSFIFRYLGITWLEIQGQNANETFLVKAAGSLSFMNG